MANKRFNQITRVVTSFGSNDVLPIGNGTLGDGKMTGNRLLELTAQNALGSIKSLATTKYKGFMALNDDDGTGKMDVDTIFNNFGGEFIPSTESNPTVTKAGFLYRHEGLLYKAKENGYQGSWDINKFTGPISISSELFILDTSASEIETELESVLDKNFETIPVTIVTRKYITQSGTIGDFNADSFVVTDYIDITGYSKLYVTGSASSANCCCVFYNTDYSVNTIAIKNPVGHPTDWEPYDNIEVVVPPTAKYMVVGGTTAVAGRVPEVKYVSGAELKKIWRGKKWCCVGDSLTERNNRTTKNYADYISEETGIAIINMGISGSGYKKKYDVNGAFYQRVANVPLDSDVVTIFGSGNDLAGGYTLGTATDTGTETIAGCVNTTIDNLYAVLPAVRLGIVSPTPWGSWNPANRSNVMAQYSALLQEICFNRSIPFLDLYHCSNLRPWDSSFLAIAYSKDRGASVHPDETGHALIAGRFRAFVESLLT